MRLLAAVLAVVLGLPAGGTFVDDDGSVHEPNIEAIAAEAITVGCDQTGIYFCPDDPVTRAQMATFLTRALDLDTNVPDLFTDDTGSTHEPAINAIAAQAITVGCDQTGVHYCPDDPVTRAQMATFLTRALGLIPIVPPPPPGTFVTPSDVGVEIGVGVVAPAPTTVVGSQTITVDGTVLENVVVDGCITIEADNVLIRNVEVRCAGYYPIKINTSTRTNITIEYSRIEGLITAKLFLITDATNVTIRNNELVGGDDAMFAEGDLDDMVFTRNYRHSPLGDESSHYDGFQLGEFSRTYGAMEISYNYFEAIPPGIGVTDLIFATNQAEVAISVIGNYIGDHGWYTLRAYNLATLDVRNNTIEATVPHAALLIAPGPHYFECNVFTDASPVTEADVSGSENATFVGC